LCQLGTMLSVWKGVMQGTQTSFSCYLLNKQFSLYLNEMPQKAGKGNEVGTAVAEFPSALMQIQLPSASSAKMSISSVNGKLSLILRSGPLRYSDLAHP
jgi:hypothetical protein